MKKLIASAAIVGATIFGATHIAGASTTSSNPLPKTWTPTAETLVTTLIDAQPGFAEYDTACVLEQIEGEFTSPRGFYKHSKLANNSPRIARVSLGVITTCGGEFTP